MSETTATKEQSEQVLAQCRVVAHLATVLAGIHSDYVKLQEAGAPMATDVVGERTAAFMELLGEMVNSMDASTDEDEWTASVFEEARRLWPEASKDPLGLGHSTSGWRDQRDELLAELKNIANADPSSWEADVRDQFRPWAQNRARHAIAKAEAASPASSEGDPT